MKMQSKIIILIAGVLLAAVGCNKQEEFDSETAGKGSVSLEIAEVNPAGLLTKAVVDGETFPQDGHIGLFLFKDENALTGFGSDYKNVKYSYNSQKGKWTASPSIKVGSTPGYLFGYYPYVDDKSTNIKGIEISSSFNGDDVMYVAKQDPVTDQTAGNVTITMKHALARVAITVVNKGYTGDAKLQSIKFEGAEIASEGTLNAVNGSITATKAQAVTLTVPSEKQQISAEGTVFECLLVPSAVVASKQSVNLSLTIDGQTKTVNLDIILASDVKSSIELNLDDSGLSVAASVTADNSQVVEVNGHRVTVAVESDVQGDILVNAYEDAGTVKIRAISISGRQLICTRDDSGTVSSTTSGDFWEFTIADIKKDLTATVDWLRSISVKSKPAWAGTVTGTGLYAKGTDLTITATANGDFAEFIGWVDTAAPTDTIMVNPYTFKVSKDASYVAVFKYILVDALTGLFTVDDGKQVRFSKGNLWCDGTGEGYTDNKPVIKSWGLETNQYATTPDTVAVREIGHISHFLWCKTAEQAVCLANEDYTEKDTLFTEKPDFAIGGINAWRTPTMAEWNYLVNERKMKDGMPRYTLKIDNSTHQLIGIELEGKTYYGMFIYPDDYNGYEVGTTGGPDTWAEIDNSGIVFLPAAGGRNRYKDFTVFNVNKIGGYLSSTLDSTYPKQRSRQLWFNQSGVTSLYLQKQFDAYSIRLVIDLQ
ncbi:MAG: fimbrillin family protein [Bacteroidales bacterium]|nr:fimbrillin family protein [Bacteroidales bacterium]